MSQPSIKKNIALSSAYQILNIILPFITAPYVSRVLGAEGIGIYSYTSSINSYFLMFAALGTATYGAREIARVRENKKEYSKLFWEIELLSIGTTLISLIVWIALSLIYQEYTPVMLVLTLAVLSNLFDISWFFSGLEQFQYLVYRNAFFKIIGVILIFILIKSPSDLLLYIGLMTLMTFLSTLSTWFVLPKFLSKVHFGQLEIKRHFRETLVYFIPTIATSVYNVLDKTMIGLFTDNMAENGYYDQANKIITPLKTVAFAALNGVLTSRMAYLFEKKEYNDVKRLIDSSLDYILFMGIGIMFGLLGVSKSFVPIFFGSGYEPVINILWILSPVVLIIGISNCLGAQYYTPSGRRRQSTKYILSGATVNLILNVILIPRYAAVGASFSTIIAEGLISYLYVKNSQGYMSFSKIIEKGWKKLVAGALMFLLIYFLSNIPLPSIIVLSLQVTFGGILYLIALTMLKDKSVSLFFEKVFRR